jgi:transcriptional regulator with XRE-family HTH domain
MPTTRATAPTIEPRGPGGRPRNWEPTPAGKRIEKLAARQGLRLQDVAGRAGISVACIYDVVSGRTADPRLSVAQAIAAALGVKLDKVFPPRATADVDQRNAAK